MRPPGLRAGFRQDDPDQERLGLAQQIERRFVPADVQDEAQPAPDQRGRVLSRSADAQLGRSRAEGVADPLRERLGLMGLASALGRHLDGLGFGFSGWLRGAFG
jgi:hypothetical protein